jgi:hypothetical protein
MGIRGRHLNSLCTRHGNQFCYPPLASTSKCRLRRVCFEERFRHRNYVWRPCLGQGSAGVAMERQKTGELTNSGGVRGGDEEDCNEKLGDEHGEAGGGDGVSTGWLISSKETCLRFYTCSPVSCEHDKPQVAGAHHILRVFHSFRPSLARCAAPVCPFSPLFHSSYSHLAGNPISGRRFHCVSEDPR